MHFVNDRFGLPGVAFFLVEDPATIDAILEHPVERVAGARLATPAPAGFGYSDLAGDPRGIRLLPQATDRAECGLA